MTTEQEPPTRDLVLSYHRRPRRRWKRWAALVVVTLPAAGWAFYGERVREYVGHRYALWRHYRTQQDCIRDSAAFGEVVMRTDGRNAEFCTSTVRPKPRDDYLRPFKPVFRRPGSLDAFQQLRPPGTGPALLPGARQWRDDEGFVACVPIKAPDGAPRLLWVRIGNVGLGGICLFASVSAPATMTQPDNWFQPGSASMGVTFEQTLGALVVRRVASPEDEVHLAFEQAGRSTLLKITSDGISTKLASDAIRPGANGLRIEGAAPAFIALSVPTSYTIAVDWGLPQQIVADEGGVFILSTRMPAELGRRPLEQVHRFDLGKRSTTLLTDEYGLPPDCRLAVDGKRVWAVWQERLAQGDPGVIINAFTCSLETLGERRRFRLTSSPKPLTNPRYCGDGRTLTFTGDNAPLFRVDTDGAWETIPWTGGACVSQNGAYIAATNNGGAVWTYDTDARAWLPNVIRPPGNPARAEVSYDGKRVFCSGGRATCVLDTTTGDVVVPFKEPMADRGACFTRNSEWLAAVCDEVELVNLKDPSRRMTGHY